MASNTVTSFPIHAENIDLVERLHDTFEDQYAKADDVILAWTSLYAPLNRMTYPLHVMYSILGHSASGGRLPTKGAPAPENKFIASDGVVLEALNREGRCEIIGTKENGTRNPLPIDTSLVYGIPPFPSVELSPKVLATLWIMDAEPALLKFPACTSDSIAQMFDFRMEDEEVQMLIHPIEVIYRVRELFRKPIKSDDADDQAAILNEIKQLYTCATAMTMALAAENDGQSSKMSHFRRVMRADRVNVTTIDMDVVRAIAPPSKVKKDSESPDGKGTATDFWFLSELLHDWGLMACLVLIAARKEIDEEFECNMCWE